MYLRVNKTSCHRTRLFNSGGCGHLLSGMAVKSAAQQGGVREVVYAQEAEICESHCKFKSHKHALSVLGSK